MKINIIEPGFQNFLKYVKDINNTIQNDNDVELDEKNILYPDEIMHSNLEYPWYFYH